MANCIQRNSCRSFLLASDIPQLRRQSVTPCVLRTFHNRVPTKALKLTTSALQCGSEMKCQEHRTSKSCQKMTAVCLLGSKDKSERDDEGSPWKSFQNAMGRFKGQSIEDVLRQQMAKQEFSDGGKGKIPPRGGGGGDGAGGSEDEGFAGIVDETVQVVLATLGFIFMYIYIITGEELTLLGRDYIKYLFGGTQSVRLKRAMLAWKRFCQKLTEKKEVDKMWLEKAIVNTPTLYDSPEKYKRILRSYLASSADQ
uniref:Uncharacterized protein LOC105628287 n=1 Tax=Rhizophora mucronata TaxID=61149 RepID=A0A2P2J9G2_RHIMU